MAWVGFFFFFGGGVGVFYSQGFFLRIFRSCHNWRMNIVVVVEGGLEKEANICARMTFGVFAPEQPQVEPQPEAAGGPLGGDARVRQVQSHDHDDDPGQFRYEHCVHGEERGWKG